MTNNSNAKTITTNSNNRMTYWFENIIQIRRTLVVQKVKSC